MKNKSHKGKKIPDKELKVYVKTIPQLQIVEQSEVTYRRLLKDKFSIARAVKHGITNQLFEEIKAASPFDDRQWAGFLNLNIRTLQRYKLDKDHLFKPAVSERIFELAEVISLGMSVFDAPDDFRIWLNTPSIALGKEKPIDFLDNSYGIDLVIAELNRIEHGVFV